MEANRALPRVVWLTLLGALISVTCFYVLFSGMMAILSALAGHHWFRVTVKTALDFSLVAGNMSLLASFLWIRHCNRKRCAPKR
jgi:hypothetical protein